MGKKKLLVIGSLNMDLVVDVPRIPEVGETLLGYGYKTVPGGKGANQAYASAKLGAETYMLGSVGTDEYGRLLLGSLDSAGVHTECIERQQRVHTGLAFICVNSDGDNNIVVVPGANGTCTKEYIDGHKELIQMCDIIVLQLEIPMDTVSYVLETAKQMNKTVILNPAPAPDTFGESLLGKIDVLTPNEIELQRLTGRRTDSIDAIKEAAGILLSKGVKNVIVTIGDKGALLVKKGECQYYPAKKVKALDTTGAGDSFTAAVAVALSEGKSLSEAMEFANKVAAVVVTREGAQTSFPARDEIK